MLLTPQQKEVLKNYGNNIQLVSGGHMAYQRFIVSNDQDDYFLKVHHDSLFTEDKRKNDSRQHLLKEIGLYRHLNQHKFKYIPEHFDHKADILILSALSSENGWNWEKPTEKSNYIKDVLEALKDLENIPIPSNNDFHKPTIEIFLNEGWNSIDAKFIKHTTRKSLDKWQSELHPNSLRLAEKILRQKYIPTTTHFKSKRRLNHHDARQTNIAWHNEKGVKIVDWSWADEGFENGDTTMFLIDLQKSDHSIHEKLIDQYFNPEYAQMLFGHWMFRAAQPYGEGGEIVRFHQFASALSAYELVDGSKGS